MYGLRIETGWDVVSARRRGSVGLLGESRCLLARPEPWKVWLTTAGQPGAFASPRSVYLPVKFPAWPRAPRTYHTSLLATHTTALASHVSVHARFHVHVHVKGQFPCLSKRLAERDSTLELYTDSYPTHYYTDLQIKPPSRTFLSASYTSMSYTTA